MEGENMEMALPQAPRGLCFDRLDFVKTNFSVDNFLEDHQNVSSLEAMRDDLGAYLKVLRLAMIELINKDYANFVNLSATLIGFDQSIEKIREPLLQMNEEVLSVKQCIEEAMKEVSMWLNQRHTLQKKKLLLKYYSQTIQSLNTLDRILHNVTDKTQQEKIVVAERSATEYNQLKFTIAKCEAYLKAEQKAKYQHIEDTLTRTLNQLLFQFWNDNDEENLLKTLITLATLDRVGETETLMRRKAIGPLLVDIINEPALQRSENGLQGIYESVLGLLDTKLRLLLTVTQHSKLEFLTRRYQFIVTFWCEVESRLEVNLASIFAPGNPDIFYTRYQESMELVRRLEARCGAAAQLMRATPEFKSFQKRWNLPVYFQIRFQEIAGSFEASLGAPPAAGAEGEGEWRLAQSARCWRALGAGWARGVLLAALAHRFWKLTLQLLLRYAAWCAATCARRPSPHRAENLNQELIDNSIDIYTDSRALLTRLPAVLATAAHQMPVAEPGLLRTSLEPCERALEAVPDAAAACVAAELGAACDAQLRQVSEVPRLYRKTNRSAPRRPCAYADAVRRTLAEFDARAQPRLDPAFLERLYRGLMDTLAVQYFKYVEDVLTSVQKTEESLRRLKQIRDKPLSQGADSGVTDSGAADSGVTDADKIRLQLQVDVAAFRQLVQSLRLDPAGVDKLQLLSDMVDEAVKNIDIK